MRSGRSHRGRRRPLLGRGRTPLRAFAERHRIPVVETVAGKSTLTHDHPNYAGPDRGHRVARRERGRGAGRRRHRRRDPAPGLHDRLMVGVQGSERAIRRREHRLLGRPQAGRPAGDRRRQGRARGDRGGARSTTPLRPSGWRRRTSGSPSGTPTSIRGPGDSTTVQPAYAEVIQAINTACDADDYIVSAAGGLPGELAMGWRSKSVGSFDSEYGYSTMGYEIAGAWGARLARPTGDVITWVGDGSYLMMNSDIYSTVMTGQKVIFMVCDNGGYRRHQPPAGQHGRRGVQQPAPDDPPRALSPGRLRQARRVDGRDRRAGRRRR